MRSFPDRVINVKDTTRRAAPHSTHVVKRRHAQHDSSKGKIHFSIVDTIIFAMDKRLK